jgi:hypothetical protein
MPTPPTRATDRSNGIAWRRDSPAGFRRAISRRCSQPSSPAPDTGNRSHWAAAEASSKRRRRSRRQIDATSPEFANNFIPGTLPFLKMANWTVTLPCFRMGLADSGIFLTSEADIQLTLQIRSEIVHRPRGATRQPLLNCGGGVGRVHAAFVCVTHSQVG